MARLYVRVQPGARRTSFSGWYGDIPKISVAAAPVDGAANDELARALASWLGLRRRQIGLVGGAMSRTKRLEIDDLSTDEMMERILELNPKRPG